MRYLAMALGAGAIVGLDQLTKYLTVQHIPLYGTVPVWDGIVHLTYFRNTCLLYTSWFATCAYSSSQIEYI